MIHCGLMEIIITVMGVLLLPHDSEKGQLCCKERISDQNYFMSNFYKNDKWRFYKSLLGIN